MCKELPQLGEGKALEETGNSDGYRRPHQDQRPPDRGRYT